MTIDAEDLFLRRYLGILDDDAVTAATARWIRVEAARRRHAGRPSTAGPATSRPRSRRTSRSASPATRPTPRTCAAPPSSSATAGGIERDARVHAHVALAALALVVGRRAGDPARADPAAAARAALDLLVRLLGAADDRRAVDRARRCGRRRRCRSAIDELRTGAAPRAPTDPWGRAFELLDRGLHRYERRPVARAAAPRAARGRALGRRPPGARRLVGRHPAAVGLVDDRRCTRSATASTTPCSSSRSPGSTASRSRTSEGRRIEACQSPVWDTALALIALLDAGLAPGRRRRSSAARAGSPAARCGSAATGRCARPDIPTGRLPVRVRERQLPRRRRHGRRRARAAARRDGDRRRRRADRGARLVARHAERAAAAGARSTSTTRASLPLQAAVLRLRRGHRPAERRRDRAHGRAARRTRASRRRSRRRDAGIDYLLREQERDGSWFGRWGANHLYGTGAAVPALAACGLARPPERARRRRLARRACRTTTAASARTCARTATPRWRGRGESTASQTAWALLAYDAAGADGPGRRARGALAGRDAAAATAAGTSRSTRAPASRATST